MPPRGKERAAGVARVRQELHHRLPRAATRLGAEAAAETRRTAREPLEHPPEALRRALVALMGVLASSATFWVVVLQEDVARRRFFPGRDAGVGVAACAAFGIVTQILMPLGVVRRMQLHGRLALVRSVRLVLLWTATSLGTFVAAAATDAVTGSFVLLAALLLVAAGVLFAAAKAAYAADR